MGLRRMARSKRRYCATVSPASLWQTDSRYRAVYLAMIAALSLLSRRNSAPQPAEPHHAPANISTIRIRRVFIIKNKIVSLSGKGVATTHIDLATAIIGLFTCHFQTLLACFAKDLAKHRCGRSRPHRARFRPAPPPPQTRLSQSGRTPSGQSYPRLPPQNPLWKD